MKKLTARTKVIIFGLFILGIGVANMNMFVDYWAGADHALIREMRLVSMQKSWQHLFCSRENIINSREYLEYQKYLEGQKLRENRKYLELKKSRENEQIYSFEYQSTPPAYLEYLDTVVLKHIPLGASANAALEICQKNGLGGGEPRALNITHREVYPGFEASIYCSIKERRWYLIGTDEYRVIVYLKNNQVELVQGRYFSELLGGL